MVYIWVILIVAVPATPQAHVSLSSPYLQNASRLLSRQFASPDVSYILLDIRSDKSIEAGWSDAGKALPAGSLVKPFTAVAYAESHDFHFPEQTCEGGSACWNPAGHGKLDIVHAIALSCNSYFSQLASRVSAVWVGEVSHRYGLAGPTVATTSAGLAGRYGEWRESPRALVRAYAELLSRGSQPGVGAILQGMAESAKSGTSMGASSSVSRIALLGKTGTAPCTHADHAPGDGFSLLAWPAETPHYILLVRLHSAPGAQAAVLAGKMVRALESQP